MVFIVNPILLNAENADKSDQLNNLLEQARHYMDHFKYDSALMLYDSASKIAFEADDEILVAHIAQLKGRAFRLSNQNDSAIIQLDKAIHLAKRYSNDTILAMAYINLANIMKDRGLSDSSLSLFQECLSLYESANDSIGLGKVYNSLAIHYKYSGDFDLGLKSAYTAKNIFSKIKLKDPLSRSLINLGNIYEKLGEYDTALACYEESYRIGEEINKPKVSITSLINKAVIYWHMGNEEMDDGDSLKAIQLYELAKAEFLRTIEISKKIDDKKTIAMLYSNISIVYRNLGLNDESITAAQEAIRLAKEVDDFTTHVLALNNLGVIYKTIKQYNKAEVYYQESLDLAQESKQKESIKKASNNLMTLYELMEDYHSALTYSKLNADYRDSLYNEAKQREIEKHKTNFEILHLKDQNQIKELDKKRIRAERNITLGIGIFVVVALLGLIIFFRMRARKNRIIALQKIQKLEDEKKLMAARSVLVGQEKERERIAQELHDGIGVLLSTASIHFSSVEAQADAKTGEMMKKANKLLKEAGQEVRQISHNMMPGVLSKFGLKEAIEDIFEDIEEVGAIEINLQLTCGEMRLAENMEIMLYRVIQEMVNNTLKHAKASKISLFISRDDNEIFIDYTDNGIGFDEDKLTHGNNLGVSGIRSRIDYLGGILEFKSTAGKGVSYNIVIPLSEKIT